MNALLAFIKKEWMEQVRSGRLMVLGILFVLFGIMNPAVAKLTPWLFEVLSDSLRESGISVGTVTVTAMDSWVQFYKNIPMALIVFILLQGGIFTREYQSGTLILSLTKGAGKSQIFLAKAGMLFTLWTGLYWMCFGITYGYNAYYWDNAIAQYLGFSAVCWWIFGLWIIGITVFFSTITKTNASVHLCTGAVAAVGGFGAMFSKLKDFIPTTLTDGNSLIYGVSRPADYFCPLIITALLTIACIPAGIWLFNRREIP